MFVRRLMIVKNNLSWQKGKKNCLSDDEMGKIKSIDQKLLRCNNKFLKINR
jgi:hypothetical protein